MIKISWMVLMIISVLALPSAFARMYYVDNSGSATLQSNTATGETPFKTVQEAINKAVSGDTIVIAASTYRETIDFTRSGESAERPIQVKAAPNALVEIKGSDIVTGWENHAGAIWKKENWPVNSQQVFVDGKPLVQIGENCPFNSLSNAGKVFLPPIGKDLKDIRDNAFWYDATKKILYIQLSDGQTPKTHLIEAAVRPFVIHPRSQKFIHLANLAFSHSNVSAYGIFAAMVNIWGESWVIENCSFLYADFAGVSVVGNFHTLIKNKFNNNGNTGITINGSDEAHQWQPYDNREPQHIILDGNESSYNNYRKFDGTWQGGGLKATNSCNKITITNHVAEFNAGPGLWFDMYCKDIIVSTSRLKSNSVGIAFEISDKVAIYNNLVAQNNYGVIIAASNDAQIFENRVFQNNMGIVIHGIPRKEHPTLRNNQIQKNLLSNNKDVDLVIYNSSSTQEISNTSDHNTFVRPDKTIKVAWTHTESYSVNNTDLNTLIQKTGQESHSTVMDSYPLDGPLPPKLYKAK